MWHRHIWKIIDKVQHPSLLEQLGAKGGSIESTVEPLAERAVIITYRCEACGSEKVARI